MTLEQRLQRKAYEIMGEVSALFMSQECKGTEIVMPSEALKERADRLVALAITEMKKEIAEWAEKRLQEAVRGYIESDSQRARGRETILTDLITHLSANTTDK